MACRKGTNRTLERQALALVVLEHVRRFPLDRLVAVCLCPVHSHDLAIHLKSVHLLHSLQCCLLAVKHNKCLALSLQTALRDDIQDRSVVLEHPGQGLLHRIDLDTLLKVVDLLQSALQPPQTTRKASSVRVSWSKLT
jgi:hypothetical protein